MEQNLSKNHKAVAPYYRLIIKLADPSDLPGIHPLGEPGYFFYTNDLPFKNILGLFPAIKIGRLFPSLEPDCLSALMAKARLRDPEYRAPDLLRFYSLDCPEESYKDDILKLLLNSRHVELAYIESEPAVPSSALAFAYPVSSGQGYLRPAPGGIDAGFAWQQSGGDGTGRVKIIDIEQGWDQEQVFFPVRSFPCSGKNVAAFANHGAAVLNTLLQAGNRECGAGIVPGANAYVVSQWRQDGSFNTADAILAAAAQLDFGDILLIEAQISETAPGDRLWPVEIQPAIFEAIRLATALGITVIEPAANGKRSFGIGNDLDQFEIPGGGYPLNLERVGFRDSYAVLVGAASNSEPHTRISSSNFGGRIDCYAWGGGITAAGYDRDSAAGQIEAYRRRLTGTSAASAIIAGCAIAIQSILESSYHFRIGPKQMRWLLSCDELGTPSANGRQTDRIGSMPDLLKIISYVHSRKHALRTQVVE